MIFKAEAVLLVKDVLDFLNEKFYLIIDEECIVKWLEYRAAEMKADARPITAGKIREAITKYYEHNGEFNFIKILLFEILPDTSFYTKKDMEQIRIILSYSPNMFTMYKHKIFTKNKILILKLKEVKYGEDTT